MYYCGVCHALRNTDGAMGQMSLTYDSTFAAVLLTALYEPDTKMKEAACMVHPVGKKIYLENEIIQYIADMNLILTYYKCLDDWADDRKFTRLCYSSFIRKRVRKIGQVYSEKLAKIRESLRTLSACERKNVTNLDLLAGTFGDIMAEILAYKPSRGIDWSEELRRLGYQLGKFIYILDAYDDVQEDIEKNRFNPLKELYHKLSKEQFDCYVKEILMMIATDMAKIYECLPIVEETAILRNIIYSGIWVRFMTKQNDTGNK
jgi:hypothetical protein